MIVSVSQAGNGAPKRIDLERAEIVLGKHPDCDVVLADPKVSRKHARIVSRDGALFVGDLGSTNGTKLNGELLSAEAPLRSGDVIEIAAFRIQIEEPQAVRPPSSSRPSSDSTAASMQGGKVAAPKPAAEAAPAAPKPKAVEEGEEAKKAKMFWASMESFFEPIWEYIENPAVSEIMVNGPREIFFERKGKLERSPATFSEEGIRAAIMNVAQFMGRRVNEENPYLDARLPDGSRVAIVLPPCSRKGPAIAIRKFAKEKLSLQDLIRFGSINEEIVTFLDIAVKLRKNMIVSGGTSSGKTSLLNVVSTLIPNEQRIIVIEDSAELQLQQDHVLPLESKPPDKHGKGEVTLRELVRASLRLRPDRIVVGEVRGGEALDLLQAMNTGHSGSLATTHASSPLQTLSRLETLTLFSGLDLPIVAIREQVSTAIDLIIQAARLPDGSRKVTHISEVLSLTPEGKYQVQDIYRFVRTGTEGERIVGEHRAAGNLPSFLEEIELAGYQLPPSLAELASRPGAREKIAHKGGGH
jgi:pilus assembly protein CpaF